MLLAGILALACGCHESPAPTAAASASANGVKQYHIRGVIVSTDPAKGEITLDTEAIPGFMDAMVMP